MVDENAAGLPARRYETPTITVRKHGRRMAEHVLGHYKQFARRGRARPTQFFHSFSRSRFCHRPRTSESVYDETRILKHRHRIGEPVLGQHHDVIDIQPAITLNAVCVEWLRHSFLPA
jgi:hypothetical protein